MLAYAVPSLERLYLHVADLGPRGGEAVAGALAAGRLPSLKLLTLNRNLIGEAVREACRGGCRSHAPWLAGSC